MKTIIVDKEAGLTLKVADGVMDIERSLDHMIFFTNLYNKLFTDKETVNKAGLKDINNVNDVMTIIYRWFDNDSKMMMFFLYKDNEVVGMTQAFTSSLWTKAYSLGYMISHKHQGQGLGTKMLKAVSKYLDDLKYRIFVGFRDGNVASERIAFKSGYRFYRRDVVRDVFGNDRPMNYYMFQGDSLLTESFGVRSKYLLTNQSVSDGEKVLKRINPKVMTLEEYIYLCNIGTRDGSLSETYFVFSPIPNNIKNKLRKNNILVEQFSVSDQYQLNINDPFNDINSSKLFEIIDDKNTDVEVDEKDKNQIKLKRNDKTVLAGKVFGNQISLYGIVV